MSDTEINSLMTKRANLATKIREWYNKGKNARDLAFQYENITNKLQELGKNVYIGTDYYKVEYWDAKSNDIVKSSKDLQPFSGEITIKDTSVIKPSHFVPEKNYIEKLVDDKIKDINYYVFCLVWECEDIHQTFDNIETIKTCFSDLGMKEITNECYQNGTSVEYMVKYRFVGSEESFNIIKTFSQNVLDGTLKRDKNNATIFGKKIII
jgi:hypothetical protein